MTWFQRLLIITIVATFALVVIGGTVRATDSGLGCPDWPTCHGKLIPKLEKHTLIEYSHRTAATVVGFLFLGVTFFTFKTERKNKLVFWLAFAAGVVLLCQIILGGITVKKDLPAEIVAAHLATAMAFMGMMIVTGVISLMRARGAPGDAVRADHAVHAARDRGGGRRVRDARARVVHQRHRCVARLQRLAALQRQQSSRAAAARRACTCCIASSPGCSASSLLGLAVPRRSRNGARSRCSSRCRCSRASPTSRRR